MEAGTVAHGRALRLEIRLFGHADVLFDGASLKFSQRASALSLLTYLIVRRGHAVTRESLAFLLFPDRDEPSALASLRRCLYLTTHALPDAGGEPCLLIDPDTIRWNNRADAFVDVVAFEQLAVDPNDHARAIDLYAGDLLEDVYDDWVLGERERLRARYLAMLASSIERRRTGRQFGGAIEHARRLLATDPWREDALRSLVAIRYESGDTAGALAEYERFVRRLRDDLAIAPMAETVAVRQSIVRNDALPGSLARPSPSYVGDAATEGARPMLPILPFVGRQRELAALRGAWMRAASGTAAFALVRGEAGVGKTRVTAELARTVAAEGGRVFVGTTASPESTPYQAVVEAIRSALPLVLARPPSAAKRAIVGRLVPELRDPSADVAGAGADEERDTSRVLDALAHVVRDLAFPRPLLLVLEDLQWAGAASVDALAAILRDARRTAMLVVATCRDEETPLDHPLRSCYRSLAARGLDVVDLELGRFDEDEVAELVTHVDGLRGRGDALVRTLFARSEGNALFLNEAISETLERADAADPSKQTTVASIVASRVARLAEDARTVAEIVAVAGAGASVSLVRDVSNLPAASVARGLDELLDRRILREAGRRANLDYVFTHHLIGDAIYARIEPAFREQRHARIARVLEARAGDGSDAREIARHYERALDTERAAHWYLTAAREAAAVYATGDTIDLATHALALAPGPDVRRALLEIREQAHGRRADRAAQRADIDELERLAGDDDAARGDVLLRRVLLARALGESGEEGRLIDELAAVAERRDDAARARAFQQRATHAGHLSRWADAIAPASAALALYERDGDTHGRLECLALLVEFTTNVGDLPTARQCLAELHERAATLADRAVESRALRVAALAALLNQQYRECFDLSRRELAIVVETGDREAEASAHGRLAASASRLDDFDVALRAYDRALELYESMGHSRGLGITYTNRSALLARLGLFDEALASIERSNALFLKARERRTIVANRVNASFARLHLGDATAALDLATSALDVARDVGAPLFEADVLTNIGNAERSLGSFDSAIVHLQASLAIRRPLQTPDAFVDDLTDLLVAYVDAGRPTDALAVATELDALGGPSFFNAHWPHYGWWAMSRAYAAAGLPERALAANVRAKDVLARFAAKITNARMRSAFLDARINRRIARD